jgi:hypothetical protein
MVFPDTTTWAGVGLQLKDILTDPSPHMPRGKGIWIWNYPRIGTPEQVRDGCIDLGLNHTILCIARGKNSYPDPVLDQFTYDVAKLVRLLKEAGIEIWGYHAPAGIYPTAEADRFIDRLAELLVVGGIVNAENAFRPNLSHPAEIYMQRLRARAPALPLGLSSNRYPLTSWTDFPWAAFREYCDFDIPQVYWVGQHNPARQLADSFAEFCQMRPLLPYIATGPAWKQTGWEVTAADIVQFFAAAEALDLQAVSFWEYSRVLQLPAVWQAIKEYPLVVEPAPEPTPEPTPEPQPEDDEMATIVEKIKVIKDAYPEATINIGVQFVEGASSPPDDGGGDDGGGGTSNVRYRVDTTGKNNNQVKVRPTPDPSVGQLYFVYHGEVVGGPGRIQNEFLYVDMINGKAAVPPGWVELQWLVKL